MRLSWRADRRTHAVLRSLLGLVLAACCAASLAGQLHGQVIRVSDGDTLIVLDAQRQQHTIRLAGIDAPEKSQPFGPESRDHLAQAVLNQAVTVAYDKHDKYGRIVGKVLAQGVDANLAQLQAGWAWHYRQYQREQSAEDRSLYSETESLAREAQKGLWQGNTPPEPPWDYRARIKTERRTATK
jgi:endonuclease YncB( thermonuclease family)